MSDALIEKLVTGPLDYDDFTPLRDAEGQSSPDCFNAVAMTIGRRFLDGGISFDDADKAMDRLFSLMVDEVAAAGEASEFAEPAYSIYLAFDDGEVSWPRGEDPVARYTRPKLTAILAEHTD